MIRKSTLAMKYFTCSAECGFIRAADILLSNSRRRTNMSNKNENDVSVKSNVTMMPISSLSALNTQLEHNPTLMQSSNNTTDNTDSNSRNVSNIRAYENQDKSKQINADSHIKSSLQYVNSNSNQYSTTRSSTVPTYMRSSSHQDHSNLYPYATTSGSSNPTNIDNKSTLRELNLELTPNNLALPKQTYNSASHIKSYLQYENSNLDQYGRTRSSDIPSNVRSYAQQDHSKLYEYGLLSGSSNPTNVSTTRVTTQNNPLNNSTAKPSPSSTPLTTNTNFRCQVNRVEELPQIPIFHEYKNHRQSSNLTRMSIRTDDIPTVKKNKSSCSIQ